ncbi:DUF3102 domain-containing protein [Cellvibrio sp. PSBB023]|uniref:DUF3102 domain-containing protein n=1 Tax=Cellvibrio sp. PSBB023 TaxID=1945512 RepID=UPI00099001EB|nr:DUF3102 domain-containing protein [Cellvibrio sp. PSBB023]AQT58697.1 hypothetical protein B0D95_00255 [Cellvibrio sp. PSBB023]
MARKKEEDTTVVIESGEVVASTLVATQSIANQASEHSLKIMDTYGEGLPYDRSRVVHETRFYMSQSAEAMLEAGKRLVILKEHEPHGDFLQIIEAQLGMASRTAQQIMQAAVKYSSPKLASKAQALAHLGKTKLFELMVEGDDQLAELTEGGTIAGLTLDDIDRMSSRELKKALREAKENLEAKDEVAAKNQKRIAQLQEKNALLKKLPADERAKQLCAEIAAQQSGIDQEIRTNFFTALQELVDHGGDHQAFINAQIQMLHNAVKLLRDEFGGQGVEWEEQ